MLSVRSSRLKRDTLHKLNPACAGFFVYSVLPLYTTTHNIYSYPIAQLRLIAAYFYV